MKFYFLFPLKNRNKINKSNELMNGKRLKQKMQQSETVWSIEMRKTNIIYKVYIHFALYPRVYLRANSMALVWTSSWMMSRHAVSEFNSKLHLHCKATCHVYVYNTYISTFYIHTYTKLFACYRGGLDDSK